MLLVLSDSTMCALLIIIQLREEKILVFPPQTPKLAEQSFVIWNEMCTVSLRGAMTCLVTPWVLKKYEIV